MLTGCLRFHSFFFFSSRRRHTRSLCDWSSDVCSSDLQTDRDRSRRALRLLTPAHRLVQGGRGAIEVAGLEAALRSEERRVGKECRSRWWPDHGKKKERGTREMFWRVRP